MGWLFHVDAAEVAKILAVNISTANWLIQDFEKLGILNEKTGFKRNRIFIFKQYLNLFER
jgi:predicted transcriptional regulator